MLKPGTILGERYEIIEKIGAGGMADVYKAKCHKLNRFVAIKVLKAEYSSNKNFVSKFRVEAQSAAGLMHPNIVNVYDVGEEDGMYYFVMELVEGITLKNYIEKKIRLSVKEAVSIAIQVSMGIEAAHNNGIIHRDIKPQNIIISKEGKVKVADFGIARAATSDTITSHAMGSVHYTSPEQARGGYSDAKSDIYSIGITLFEMVTGRVPFDGETTVAIAIKHIQEEMPSPRIYVQEIPISVEQIIFKCTQKNPDRRYQNMGELIQDLKRSLINPDENFVTITQAASSEGTKAITDVDRRQIRQQTTVGPAFGDSVPPTYGAGYAEPLYEQPYEQNGYQQPGYQQPGYQPNGYAPGGYGNEFVQTGYDQSGYQQKGYSESPYEEPVYQEPIYGGYQEEDEEELAFSPRSSRKNKEKGHSSRDEKTRNSKSNPQQKRYHQVEPNEEEEYYEEDEELDDDVDPKMEKVMTVLMIVAAIIIALVAIFVVGKVLGLFGTSSSENTAVESESGMVAVPNVVGISVEDAGTALKEAGLTAKASYQESADYEKDFIISQDIAADTQVEKGSVLTLVVSSGKTEGVAVPDVVGKSEAEAKVALENEGFTLSKEYSENDSVEKGNVISQSPLGATNAVKGSSVKVVVSSGKTSTEVEVPDLVGKDETTAKSLLTAAGLSWSTISEENNNSVLAGLVISQTYSAGMKVEAGTSVDFTVSLGASGFSCSYNISAPADYLAGTEAIIVLLDAAGNELQRYSTTTFPYAMVKTGITGSESGVVTVTYQKTDGQWETTAPVAVTFTKE